MSKLFSLVKATMSGGIEIFNYRVKDNRFRHIMPITLGVLFGLIMFFCSNAMMAELSGEGVQIAILALFALITTVIILMEGVYKSGDLLFRPRDNDMLLSMPIRKSQIAFARVLKFYLFELVYALIFLLPAMIAYALNAEVGASYYLVAVTALMLIPIIPIVVSSLVGLVSMAISTRFRHKTLLQVVLSLIALTAVSVIMIMINTSSGVNGGSIVALTDRVSAFYYPIGALKRLVENFEILEYLGFISMHFAVMAGTVLIIGKFYFGIVNRLSIAEQAKRINVSYSFARHSQFMAIVRKEITRYFNTPVLLVNTAIGLVIFIVVAVILCFNFEGIVGNATAAEDYPLTLDEIRFYMPVLAYAMVGFASLMTFITSTTFSLEGKAFNLLKTLPVSSFTIILAKVWAAMMLVLPVTVLGSLLIVVRFQFSVIDAALLFVGVVAMPLVAELIGVLIDLKYARFDAESDTVVVKQSAGVMVSTFIALGTFLSSLVLMALLLFVMGQTAGLAVMDGVFIVISLILLLVLKESGEERIRKLSA